MILEFPGHGATLSLTVGELKRLAELWQGLPDDTKVELATIKRDRWKQRRCAKSNHGPRQVTIIESVKAVAVEKIRQSEGGNWAAVTKKAH